MHESDNIYIPRVFEGIRFSNKIRTFEGLTKNVNGGEHKIDLENGEYLYHSISDFVNDFTQTGLLHNNIARFTEDTELQPQRFSLLVHQGLGRDDRTPYDAFYYDGTVNLLLFYGNTNKRIGVTAGLSSIKYCRRDDDLDVSNIDGKELIINQLQGPTFFKKDSIQKTFAGFRWEQFLAGIYLLWASQENIPSIYLLPSKFSGWDCVKLDENNTSYLRYDVTAKRLGFRRQYPDQPYKRDMIKDWQDVFETFVR